MFTLNYKGNKQHRDHLITKTSQ